MNGSTARPPEPGRRALQPPVFTGLVPPGTWPAGRPGQAPGSCDARDGTGRAAVRQPAPVPAVSPSRRGPARWTPEKPAASPGDASGPALPYKESPRILNRRFRAMRSRPGMYRFRYAKRGLSPDCRTAAGNADPVQLSGSPSRHPGGIAVRAQARRAGNGQSSPSALAKRGTGREAPGQRASGAGGTAAVAPLSDPAVGTDRAPPPGRLRTVLAGGPVHFCTVRNVP